MFWTFSLSIIRSLALYTQQQAYVIQVMLTASILIQLASSQQNLYDIYPLLCVQCQTPDDGQKTCPKHVEFYCQNKFEKLVHLVGFIIRIYHDARSCECLINKSLCTSHCAIRNLLPLGQMCRKMSAINCRLLWDYSPNSVYSQFGFVDTMTCISLASRTNTPPSHQTFLGKSKLYLYLRIKGLKSIKIYIFGRWLCKPKYQTSYEKYPTNSYTDMEIYFNQRSLLHASATYCDHLQGDIL